MREQPIIRLDSVTLRVRDRFLLPGTSWQIDKGQHWAILGPNGAGKTSLVKALTGEVAVVAGIIYPPPALTGKRVGYVSFEQHQRLIAREEKRDEARSFSGTLERLTTVDEMLRESVSEADIDRAAAQLQIRHLLGRELHVLSTGEMRKVQIARALVNAPELLILDEPFDGLDQTSRDELAGIIDALMDVTRTVILVTHRQREILFNISHVLAIRDGTVLFQGRREDVLTPSRMEKLYKSGFAAPVTIPLTSDGKKAVADPLPEILVSMKHVTVRYENTTVLDDLNWTMKSGENWVVTGPNGAGKSTLLSLIVGDNPQAYANEIYLFGKRRGTGESVWEIKDRIGLISSEFQIRYRKPLTAFEAVLSGFFDSVGLYRNATPAQRETAGQWMEVLGIDDLSQRIFNQLSYGQQRMVLLARSMVKMPRILILDEPCQGLDRTNRRRILEAVEVIGSHNATNTIYVTHYADEIPACMTHMLEFERAAGGRYRINRRRI